MIGENRQLITNEPVEFEKYPVEVPDCKKITDHFRRIHRIYPNLITETRGCEPGWLHLQSLGSQPVMPKYLPDYCCPYNICLPSNKFITCNVRIAC
jgi:hypothetical protein